MKEQAAKEAAGKQKKDDPNDFTFPTSAKLYEIAHMEENNPFSDF